MKKISVMLLPLLILTACGENKEQEVKPIDVVNTAIVLKFYEDYTSEEHELITWDTIETFDSYYLTDCYYRIDFDNNIYKTEYISAFDSEGQIVFKEIK